MWRGGAGGGFKVKLENMSFWTYNGFKKQKK